MYIYNHATVYALQGCVYLRSHSLNHLYRNRGAIVTYMNRETVNTGCGST